ncbi:hypothetical protein BSZ37_12910 [Rubrivirga marina]|uniref:Transposase IS4-like domain-containing protein n=2 Tax=Rubrivirga marina TaxID=1196024 RepID=A0A271J1N5_9BACT|nr:hypothetical protein BSZ37_12910 [Rubrivirga marina]
MDLFGSHYAVGGHGRLRRVLVRGFYGGRRVAGRKRHVLVDTEGLVVACHVTGADVSDQAGARRLLGGLRPLQPRLALLWADRAYGGRPLAAWAAERSVWVEIVRPEPGQRGFVVRPRRRVVERTFAWLGRYRRLAKDYEWRVELAEALIKPAMVRLMLRRLARPGLARQTSSGGAFRGSGHAG